MMSLQHRLNVTPRGLKSVLGVAVLAVAPIGNAVAQDLIYPSYGVYISCDEALASLTTQLGPLGEEELGQPIVIAHNCGGGGPGPYDPQPEAAPPHDSSSPGGDTCPEEALATANTVTLRYGNKFESVDDIRVRIPGRDFVITRRYSSNLSYLNAIDRTALGGQ